MKICTICGAVMGIGSPHSEEIKRQWECWCGNIATEIYTLAEREEIRQKAFADSLIGKMPEIRQFALEQLQTRDKWESEFWHQYGEEIDLQFSNDDGGFEVYAYPVKPSGETDTSIFVEIKPPDGEYWDLPTRQKMFCNECGDSVGLGSGKFINRIPDCNSVAVRREMGKPFPDNDYVCGDCDEREEKDDEIRTDKKSA